MFKSQLFQLFLEAKLLKPVISRAGPFDPARAQSEIALEFLCEGDFECASRLTIRIFW